MKTADNERLIRNFLERMFGVPLQKRKLVIGYDSKSKPQIHEFDLVSDDMSIVGEIKSGKKSTANYLRALADCIYLTKVNATKKVLVLTNKEFYKYFRANSEGVIASDIDIMLLCPEELPVIMG